MIVEKPKPKQLQSQPQVEAIIFSNPGTDGINRVIFLFLQTNDSKINTNHVSYFANKPTSIPCLFLVGISNHFLETMKKPTKTKTNCVTTFDNHFQTTLTRLKYRFIGFSHWHPQK